MTLRERVDGHGEGINASDAEVAQSIVNVVLVDLIGDYQYAVSLGDIGDLLQRLGGYTAPVGLLGVFSMIALVFGVIASANLPGSI